MNRITKLVEAIKNDGCGIYTNDAGNGSGGPGYICNDDIQTLLDIGYFEDFVIIKTAWDDRSSTEIISNTLEAHNETDNDTDWILAESVDDQSQNPYRKYLLLWEV